MHKMALTGLIEIIRTRYAEGDCPTEPRPSGETLENAILDLATEVDKLSASGMGRVHRLCDFLEKSDWRTIGTLPEIDPDSCRSPNLLGCWPNGSMMVVYLDVCNDWMEGNGWMDSESGTTCVTMPTHWQPLPEPPQPETV